MNKLVIIRGNSGAGKTTIANELRSKMDGKVAVIGLDTLRRVILNEEDSVGNTDILGLLDQTISYCLSKNYDIILEGILSKPKYGSLIEKLVEDKRVKSHIFYLDVSFEETVRRHETRPTAHAFGEKEMRDWYQEKNYLNTPNEIILSENLSQDESIDLILNSLK